jgi:hypothetical protein
MNIELILTLVATLCFGITLVRHILFKRELFKLKKDMKDHMLTHGFDDQLWDIFTVRTRQMLTFWR